jgi:hypothetical protein
MGFAAFPAARGLNRAGPSTTLRAPMHSDQRASRRSRRSAQHLTPLKAGAGFADLDVCSFQGTKAIGGSLAFLRASSAIQELRRP